MDRLIDRQIDRHIDRQIDRQIARYTDRQPQRDAIEYKNAGAQYGRQQGSNNFGVSF